MTHPSPDRRKRDYTTFVFFDSIGSFFRYSVGDLLWSNTLCTEFFDSPERHPNEIAQKRRLIFLYSMKFDESIGLGRTGLKVGRMGIASGYWAPAKAIEEAFERGCNYMTWGTFIKGYSPHMRDAIRNIKAKGQRDRLVLAIFSYSHQSFLTEYFLSKGLKAAGLDYADALILGYFPKRPSQRILDGAIRLKEKGLIRFIGVSSHNRLLFPNLCKNETDEII